MGYHNVVIVPLTALSFVLLGAVGPKVHRRRIVLDKERLPLVVTLVDEAESMFGCLFIDGFHAFLGEGARVLNFLSALTISPAVQHTSGSEPLFEFRVFRIVRVLRLFLGIEVVKIAKKLVETVLS